MPLLSSLAWGSHSLSGNHSIGCKVRSASHALARRGHLVHEYLFTATPSFSLNYHNLSELGAFHGAEVPFAFYDAFELATAAERALSAAMGCYWRNFAHTGDPNRGQTDAEGHTTAHHETVSHKSASLCLRG